MAAVFPLVDSETPRAVPGLIWAFRFGRDGSAEALPVDRAIVLDRPDDGWLWLYFNLMDQRSRHWLAASSQLHSTARDALLSFIDRVGRVGRRLAARREAAAERTLDTVGV